MNNLADNTVTYEQVSQVLTKLGFTRTDTAEYIAFRNAAHNALLALPPNPPEQRMDAAHLIAVRSTVTGSGVASENTLNRLLAQAATDTNPLTAAMPTH